MTGYYDDLDNNNEEYSDISQNIVQVDIATGLVCPFISGNGQIVRCVVNGCMAWQWLNDNTGSCLMFD